MDSKFCPVTESLAKTSDLPSVHFNQLLTDGEANAKPSFRSIERPVPLHEQIE